MRNLGGKHRVRNLRSSMVFFIFIWLQTNYDQQQQEITRDITQLKVTSVPNCCKEDIWASIIGILSEKGLTSQQLLPITMRSNLSSRCRRGALVVVKVLLHQAVLGGPIQAGRLFAREGILRVVADKSLLVKHCPITTEETPPVKTRYNRCYVLNWRTTKKFGIKKWLSVLQIYWICIVVIL